MVMDFDSALALSSAAGGRMTETGLSLGTPHYMSPEPATADQALTGRSDQYSLATVAYEMLSGNPPHTGSSAQQIIMRIIAEPVKAVTRYRKSVPANVAAALARALEKIPADRFENTKAFADALGNPAFTPGLTSGAVRDPAAPKRRPPLALLAATTLVSTGAAAWGFLRAAPQTSAHPVVTRAFVTLPDSVHLMRSWRPGSAFTPSIRHSWLRPSISGREPARDRRRCSSTPRSVAPSRRRDGFPTVGSWREDRCETWGPASPT